MHDKEQPEMISIRNQGRGKRSVSTIFGVLLMTCTFFKNEGAWNVLAALLKM